MTRSEFIRDVVTFEELRDFANDNDLYDALENLVDDEDINCEVNDALADLCEDRGWRDVREILDDIPSYVGWFIKVGYLEYEDVCDETFEELKEALMYEADDNEVWDDEEEPDEDGCDAVSVIASLFDIQHEKMDAVPA